MLRTDNTQRGTVTIIVDGQLCTYALPAYKLVSVKPKRETKRKPL